MTAGQSARAGPYPGPQPYLESDREVFCGRTRESYEVFDLVRTYPVVLLYAQSGAGKTSLVNAGIRPLLLESETALARIRVTGGPERQTARAGPANLYLRSALASAAADLPELGAAPASLPEAAWPERETVLCFDQFEELFTSPDRWREREEFLEEVAKLLKDPRRENIHCLFVVREDYLAAMLRYASVFPKGLSIRYHLEQLRTEAALQAIVEPAAKYRKRFEAGVAEQLVKDLAQIQTESSRGVIPFRPAVSVEGEWVEPVHLQVVCTQLWTNLPKDTATIGARHVQTFGGVDRALTSYYEQALAAALETGDTTEEQLRDWFETKLLTSGGTRGLVYEGAGRTEGMPNSVVKVLADRHVIRAEPRAAGRWYELTHDRFIKPVLDSNRAWRRRQVTVEKAAVSLGGPVVAVSLIVVVAGLVYLLAAFLPPFGADHKPAWSAPVRMLGRSLRFNPEARLFWLVALAAAFGSYVRTVVSFSQALFYRTLSRSWIVWFVLQIPVAIALSLVLYLQFRAVFVPDRLPTVNLNVYGVLALFGLAGFYAPAAIAAMRGVAEDLLGAPAAAEERRASAGALVRPRITALEPASVRAGSGSVLVRLRGANFDKDAVVTVNGAARRSVFVGTAETIVYLEPADTAAAGFLRLMVRYPPPSDAASAEVLLPVSSAGGEHA
jgi:hypothetical protein